MASIDSMKNVAVMLLMVNGFACTNSSGANAQFDRHIAEFDYQSGEIVHGRYFACERESVDLVVLLPELKLQVDHLLRKRGLEGTLDILDYSRPNLIGFKEIDSEPYVKYMFATYKDPNVILPGEGGLMVVANPCSAEVVYANLFRN